MNQWNNESDHARMRYDYDDIINLPHYEPKHHPRMSMMARAAQFAPFAAVDLSGQQDRL